jgi:transcription elongation factor Elf1
MDKKQIQKETSKRPRAERLKEWETNCPSCQTLLIFGIHPIDLLLITCVICHNCYHNFEFFTSDLSKKLKRNNYVES